MSLRLKSKKNREVDVADLYALKPGRLWAAMKNEHASLWLLVLYFFFEYVRPQSLYPVLDILPWTQLCLIVAIVATVMDRSVKRTGNELNVLFVLFGVIVVLSAVFAYRPSISLNYWTVFGGWFLVYFLVISIVNTEKRLVLFIFAYCLFNFKMAQHGTVVLVQRGFTFADYGINGAPGWFRNSGEFAIQMLIFGSLIISIVVGLKDYWGRYKKWFMYVVACTGFLSVMGASSRGAQIALVVMGVWILLQQKNGFKGLLVMSMMAIILFNILPEQQLQRFQNIGMDEDSLQRLSYWEYGIKEVIPDNPILGVGYYNWVSYMRFVLPGGLGPLEKIEGAHNIFVQVTAELGILGLICFLFLIAYGFVNNARTRRIAKKIDNKFFYALAYGLDAGLIGYLVAGCFVTVLYYPFFWVQIAMIAMVNSVAKNTYRMSVHTSRRENFIEPYRRGRVPDRRALNK